ncbi:probable plastid-lipid-associated protein 14, chloroplastic [Cannabis sativa]|uniref:probable plastid-lipid-associated protein 14, chloroplastic n=1 Tax=Cannabis sativa TaxID=3483 RepID=UPI0029CA2C6D|nr:probable plastid-lipid-associated protein 14, chloroplastic [Cannabis sativa]
MALSRISTFPSLESSEFCYGNRNLLTRLNRPSPMLFIRKNDSLAFLGGVRCTLSRKDVTSVRSEGNGESALSVSIEQEEEEEERGHVVRFKISDFKIINHISVGLGARADEVVFEAIVKNPSSPLYGSRVVLRRLISAQAQRRGKRAIEVLKRLVRRRLLYHSYSMQVHGYISSITSSGRGSFTLVHGYQGSFSLRHWLQQSDWLPTLEATLALDDEYVRRVGDDKIGGSAVSRQLRIIRILMRDLLIGVNYLHSHGLAHTELKLENVHICPVDRHIKVGILGNAADFYEEGPNSGAPDNNIKRRQMMIAFDMRCVGFMMAKMVLRELMDPLVFTKFKSFLTKGNDPSCLREFLLQLLNRNSSFGNAGLQMLDRNWGAGWNLLSLLLATEPSNRISCLDALRHPFLCGPRWKVVPSMNIIRWGLGSTAVRISEEYIYGHPQRRRLAHFIELMEMLNPHPKPKNWLEFLPGKWRLLYCTGKHIGLTFRQPPARVLVGNVNLTISRTSKTKTAFSLASEIDFTVMLGQNWPHDKTGVNGKMQVNSLCRLTAGKRLYIKEEDTTTGKFSWSPNTHDSVAQKLSGRKWRKAVPFKELPTSLPVAKLVSNDIDVTLNLGDPLKKDVATAGNVVQEIRLQIPPEMFDLTKLVCGTYVDSRLLVVRGVNGSALLFTRSCIDENLR